MKRMWKITLFERYDPYRGAVLHCCYFKTMEVTALVKFEKTLYILIAIENSLINFENVTSQFLRNDLAQILFYSKIYCLFYWL